MASSSLNVHRREGDGIRAEGRLVDGGTQWFSIRVGGTHDVTWFDLAPVELDRIAHEAHVHADRIRAAARVAALPEWMRDR